jgi:hypothetical protein
MLRYIFNILVSLDITLNAIFGGKRYETLSASAWIGEQQGKVLPCFFRPIIDFIFRPFESDHCQRTAESEARLFQRPSP